MKLLVFVVALFALFSAGHGRGFRNLPPINKLKNYVNKNFQYLTNKGCGFNCTYQLCWGLAEYYILDQHFGPLKGVPKSLYDEFVPKYYKFVTELRDKNPTNDELQILLIPEYYPQTNHYVMTERIPKTPAPVRKSLEQIVADTVPNDLSRDCYSQMITNGRYNTERVCNLECESMMRDNRTTYPMSFDERVSLLTVQTFLNCTNIPKPEILDISKVACEVFGPQARTMYNQRNNRYFNRVLSLYLNKLLFCGTYGFPQLFEDDYINDIINRINKDGSVGTKDHSAEEKEVLTAQVIVILTSVMRTRMELIDKLVTPRS